MVFALRLSRGRLTWGGRRRILQTSSCCPRRVPPRECRYWPRNGFHGLPSWTQPLSGQRSVLRWPWLRTVARRLVGCAGQIHRDPCHCHYQARHRSGDNVRSEVVGPKGDVCDGSNCRCPPKVAGARGRLGRRADCRVPFDRDRTKQTAANLAKEGVFIGTSSWKYEGWFEQLYTPARYEHRGKVAKVRFERDCLREYAEVFKTVSVDAAYYDFPRRE